MIMVSFGKDGSVNVEQSDTSGTPAPAERKPVAGWERTPTGRCRLRVGPLTATATERRTWDVAVTCGATGIVVANGDAADEAKLAAEDALFAIADAINALRGGQ